VRKELLVLVCMVGMAQAFYMMATPNATIYVNVPVNGSITTVNMELQYCNELNESINVNMQNEQFNANGQLTYNSPIFSTPNTVTLPANPEAWACVQEKLNETGKYMASWCCDLTHTWQTIPINVTVPERIIGRIEGSVEVTNPATGATAVSNSLKNIVITLEPKGGYVNRIVYMNATTNATCDPPQTTTKYVYTGYDIFTVAIVATLSTMFGVAVFIYISLNYKKGQKRPGGRE
jgi:hypothetical protein